jgi:hypothetical protein
VEQDRTGGTGGAGGVGGGGAGAPGPGPNVGTDGTANTGGGGGGGSDRITHAGSCRWFRNRYCKTIWSRYISNAPGVWSLQ